MKCGRCREPAVIEVRRHNAAYCRDCFVRHCEEQVRRAIDTSTCSNPASASSLRCRAARTRSASGSSCASSATTPTASTSGSVSASTPTPRAGTRASSRKRAGGSCIEVDLADDLRFRRRERVAALRSACRARRAGCRSGTSSTRPRSNNGYDVLATGHNLDDEAAVLFGNVLRWETEFLGRQHPVLPAGAGIRAQGETADPAGRARARGVLRADRHRLHRRGVPDGGRQPPSWVQERPERDRGTFAGHQGCVRVRLPRARPATLHRRGRRRARRPAPCTSCGAPTPGDVCAFCRMRARAVGEPIRLENVPVGDGVGRLVSRALRGRRTRAARRQPAPAAPRHARRRRPVPHPRGHHRARRHHRSARRHDGAHDARRALDRAAAHTRGVHPRDAAWRAGDLSEGHRADPRCSPTSSPARACSSRASDPARSPTRCCAAIGPTGSVTGYEIREDFAERRVGERARIPRYRRAARRPSARHLRGHRRARRRPSRARPARAVARREARGRSAGPGRHPAGVPPDDPAGRPAPRGAAIGPVRDDRVARGAAPHLARRGAVDPPRPPHGRAHRIPHRRPPPRRRLSCTTSSPGANERTRRRDHRGRDRSRATAAGGSASSLACSRGPACSPGSRSASTSSPRSSPGWAARTPTTASASRCCSSSWSRRSGRPSDCVIGLLVHRVFPLPNPLPLWDRIAGARLGAVGLLVLDVAGHPRRWPPPRAGPPAWHAPRSWSPRSSGSRRRQPSQSRRGAWRYPKRRIRPRSTRSTRPPDPGAAPTTRLWRRGRRDGAPLDREGDGRGLSPDPGRQRLGGGAGDRRHERARGGGGAVDVGHRFERRRRCPRSSSRSTRCATSRCCRSPDCNAAPLVAGQRIAGRRRRGVRPSRRRPLVAAARAHRRRDRRGRHEHLPHVDEPAARVRARLDVGARRLGRRARRIRAARSWASRSRSTPGAAGRATRSPTKRFARCWPRRQGTRGRHRCVPRRMNALRREDYSASMKMHSPGHSSADSTTASSMPSGMLARPSAPPGSE